MCSPVWSCISGGSIGRHVVGLLKCVSICVYLYPGSVLPSAGSSPQAHWSDQKDCCQSLAMPLWMCPIQLVSEAELCQAWLCLDGRNPVKVSGYSLGEGSCSCYTCIHTYLSEAEYFDYSVKTMVDLSCFCNWFHKPLRVCIPCLLVKDWIFSSFSYFITGSS